jgi:hypothetical protein
MTVVILPNTQNIQPGALQILAAMELSQANSGNSGGDDDEEGEQGSVGVSLYSRHR